MPSANESLRDEAVEHAVNIQRYSRGLATRLLKLLLEAEQRILEELEGMPTEFQAARLRVTLARIREILSADMKYVREELRIELRNLAAYEVEREIASVQRVTTGMTLDFSAPTKRQILSTVLAEPFENKMFTVWLAGVAKATSDRIEKSIKLGIIEGKTLDQIIREVRGSKDLAYKDGLMQGTRREVEAIVRTAVNDTLTQAREQVYQRNSDIVKGVQWVSTLDERTTLICISRDGEVYAPNSGPRPPAHFNCRSTTVPVLKSWEELGLDMTGLPVGTRASMDGQVPATMTYEQWLRGKPAEFQDEVLGKTRAALFREGKLSVKNFVDASGHVYTLDQLRKRESGAFKRARVA